MSLQPSFNVRSYASSGHLVNPHYTHVAASYECRPKTRPEAATDRSLRDAHRLIDALEAGLVAMPPAFASAELARRKAAVSAQQIHIVYCSTDC